jgi:hypothetical protein
MYVKVNNCHPADMVVVDGCQRSAGDVVEDAVATSIAAFCMVTRRPAGHVPKQCNTQRTKSSCCLLPTPSQLLFACRYILWQIAATHWRQHCQH